MARANATNDLDAVSGVTCIHFCFLVSFGSYSTRSSHRDILVLTVGGFPPQIGEGCVANILIQSGAINHIIFMLPRLSIPVRTVYVVLVVQTHSIRTGICICIWF